MTNSREEAYKFSVYGVFRFALYIIGSFALIAESFQIAGMAFGLGAGIGFFSRLSRYYR